MKSAPLGSFAGSREWSVATEALLVGGDRMTALIHSHCQRWKNVNFFTKNHFLGLCLQHVQTLCMPSLIDLHTYAIAGHVTSFACSRNTSDRLVCIIARHEGLRDRSQPRWNMKHFRQTVHSYLKVDCTESPVYTVALPPSTGMRHAVGALFSTVIICVMNGHNARRPRTGRERGPWWRLSEASYLTVWMIERSILRFPSLLHDSEGALRIMSKGIWEIESFLWGGRFGRPLLCPGKAKMVNSRQLADKRVKNLSTKTYSIPIRGVMSKGVWWPDVHWHTHIHRHALFDTLAHTCYTDTCSHRVSLSQGHTHAHTLHCHTRNFFFLDRQVAGAERARDPQSRIKEIWTARSQGASAHVTRGKNNGRMVYWASTITLIYRQY